MPDVLTRFERHPRDLSWSERYHLGRKKEGHGWVYALMVSSPMTRDTYKDSYIVIPLLCQRKRCHEPEDAIVSEGP